MRSTIHSLFVVGVLYCVAPARAAPMLDIVTLGFTGPEYTRDDGYKYSFAYQLNQSGRVIGSSDRYNGAATFAGRSAWLYDGTTTIEIGLTGNENTGSGGYWLSEAFQLNEAGQARGLSYRAEGGVRAWIYNGASTIDIGLSGSEYTGSNGIKYSFAEELNESGQLRGYSVRYAGGGNSLGQSAWFYDGVSTTEIGLKGSAYTRSDGFRVSVAFDLNDAGQIVGLSQRYNGGIIQLGESTWLFNGTNTIEIGLTGSEHTRNDGFRYSIAYELNEAGQVFGKSSRFNTSGMELGQTAWFYNGVATIDIGLIGLEHTRVDGSKVSIASDFNENGQVIGFSNRYSSGGSYLGQSAWLYDGATTIDIGLVAGDYTGIDGYRYSETIALNEAGQVIGHSNRFGVNCFCGDDRRAVNSRSDLGRSAWFYDGTTTIEIGLMGSEYTTSGGYRFSEAYKMNEAGQAIGYSLRHGTPELGRGAWFFDGTATTEIGLTGSKYTASNGVTFSAAEKLNNKGQVIGHSRRVYDAIGHFSQDAWFFDPALNLTFALQLSSRSDGYAYSSATYLNEDGLVLGYYTLFDASDNNMGQRAFYFTVADGLHDLGILVDDGLLAGGWDWLANVVQANGRGQILGYGKLNSQSDGRVAYLLTPVVPEPSTLFLATLAALGWHSRRPRPGHWLRELFLLDGGQLHSSPRSA